MATLAISELFPSPAEDAERLHTAFQGWGADGKAIISLLAHRDAAQRSSIIDTYQQIYGEDLIGRLQSELSGHFETAVYWWIFEPFHREAVMANTAVSKEIDYKVLVEIASTRSSNELLKIRQAYHARYKCSLEEDVAAHSTGDLRKLLVALVSSYRYEGGEVDATLAKFEAKILKDTIDGNAGDHEDLIRIITTRSKEQLSATFNKYRDDYGQSLTKDLIKPNPDDEFLTAVRAAIRSINDPHRYFAKVLRQALNIVDEDALARVIVTRAEFDLKGIEEVFYKRNSIALDESIRKATSGDYKTFLLGLLGSGEY